MAPDELDHLLAEAEQDASRVASVLEALRDSALLLPVPEQGQGSDALVLDGVPHLVAFTSERQMQRAGRTGPYATAPVRELVATLPPSVGLALNPGGTGFPVHPSGLPRLTDGPVVLPAGTRVRIGEPEDEPARTLEAVARGLAGTTATEARRAWVQVGDAVPGLAVGVRTPSGALDDELLEAVRLAVAEVDDAVVDLLPLDGDDPVSTWMRANVAPFFTA